MEKYSDDQFVIKKEEGKLTLRLPGGETIKYDNRFSNIPNLLEGETYVVPNVESK